ncbi:MAG: hypothetical protein ACXVCX_08535 [Ktedonobacterales bacterium]
MVCPNCGLPLAGANVQACPRCGYPLRAVPTQTPDYGYAGSPQGNAGQQEFTAPYAPASSAPDYSVQPPVQPDMPLYGQAAPPSYPMYGPQGTPPAYPTGYPPYGQYGPYGQGAPVTTPFYGQAAPPSYPLYGPSMPGAYPPAGWPSAQPQPKRGNGFVIGLSIGIVAVILLASIAAVAFVQNARNGTAAIPLTTLTPMVTATTSAQRILFQDKLTSDINGWANDDHCFFGTDGYHIRDNWQCYAPAGVLTDFDLTVQVKQIHGALDYPYGIVFRHSTSGSEYHFFITSDSYWRLSKCVSNTCSSLVNWSSASALQGGLNTTHTLEVRAKGTHVSVAADGKQLGSTDDATFSSGRVGLVAGKTIETVFTAIKITTVQ